MAEHQPYYNCDCDQEEFIDTKGVIRICK